MPRTAEQYAAMRSDTHEKIQAAAIGLFARKGFAATSVRDIAQAAEISTGLMYRHYATKEALFDDLASQAADGLARVTAAFEQAIEQEAPPAEPIREFVREFAADLAADNGFAEFSLIMSQALVMPDRLPHAERLAEQHRALAARTTELIERGQRRGEFAGGAAGDLTTCFFALLDGLASMKFVLGADFTPPDPSVVTALLIKEDR
ncbi:TetR/AcrR family transcriptional regulator [Saccharopolyspora sp. NPDC050642]|uniref:TetR/AcrR family transcriptional regulator n=1 Tax=Saccharopolyspora sp. NPDC050642 TaxID=3157099 RepID=UPI0033E6B99E